MQQVLIGIAQQGNLKPQILPWIHEWSRTEGISIVSRDFQPYEKNLNSVLNLAVNPDYGQFSHVLLLDHDNIPTKNPLDLVKLNKDIIGCPYPNYTYNNGELDVIWMAYKLKSGAYKPIEPSKGLEKVDAVASGCVLISRKVIESGLRFEWRHDERGEIQLGLDLNFCEQARHKGFEVWTDWSSPCDHIKERSLLEILKWKNKNQF